MEDFSVALLPMGGEAVCVGEGMAAAEVAFAALISSDSSWAMVGWVGASSIRRNSALSHTERVALKVKVHQSGRGAARLELQGGAVPRLICAH